MSIFSDYAAGALSDEEFRSECSRMNAEDRWEREHEDSDFRQKVRRTQKESDYLNGFTQGVI